MDVFLVIYVYCCVAVCLWCTVLFVFFFNSFVCFVFFFFKQKTAYEMRISDWSSDVCSSDLLSSGRTTRCGGRSWRPSTGSGARWMADAAWCHCRLLRTMRCFQRDGAVTSLTKMGG